MRTVTSRLRITLLAVFGLAVSGIAIVGTAGPGDAATPPYVVSTQLPLPAGAANPRINGVGCGAPGFCVAVGSYASGATAVGLIETLSGGHWTATSSPIPAGASGGSALAGISCSGSSTCAAWGGYSTGPSTSGYMAVLLSAGQWKATALSPPLGGTFPSGGYGNNPPIAGIGCSGSGACTIVGNYFDSGNSSRGWVDAYSGGAWQGARKAVTPPDTTGQGEGLTGLSCGGGLCQAVGTYVNSSGFQSLEITVNPDGSMNAPFAGKLPTGAPSAPGLQGIACSAGGICTGYGEYYSQGNSSSASDAESYVVGIGGTAFQPQQPPTTIARSATIFPSERVFAAGCAGGGCVVSGVYNDTTGGYHPLLDRFVNGGWVADTAPSTAYPNSIACGAATFCVGVDGSQSTAPADVLIGSTWTTAPILLPGNVSGPEVAAQPLACDSASSCWIVGEYSSSLFADEVTTTSPPPPNPGVTSGQVASWFHAALVPTGTVAKIENLLKARGLTVALNVTRAGTLKIVWTSTRGVIAVTRKVFTRSGRFLVKIALTRTGLSVLRKVSRLPIKTSATFTVSGHSAVAARGQTVLRR
ncbi:MAG TPA: hypothetical protein VN108_08035 [Marmoricola sp.]|nr:hypothetical protein [Marmoricola sp.]